LLIVSCLSECLHGDRDRLRLLTTSDWQPQNVIAKFCKITSIAEDQIDL
jgi:hypothetical protein